MNKKEKAMLYIGIGIAAVGLASYIAYNIAKTKQKKENNVVLPPNKDTVM